MKMKKIVVVTEGWKLGDSLVHLLALFFPDCEVQAVSRREHHLSSTQDKEETR